MKNLLLAVGIFALLCLQPGSSQTANPHTAADVSASQYVPIHRYDPSRNALQDFEAAKAEAQRTGKNILLEVGGDWCPGCRSLDQFYKRNPKVVEVREKYFVTLYVNCSEENDNREFLKKFPEVLQFPHLFVLTAKGKLLRAMYVNYLTDGDGTFNPDRFITFYERYSPKNNGK